MKLFKKTALALSLVAAPFVNAEQFAITNATVYTATDAGVLEKATVVVTDGKITAINPQSLDVAKVIDGSGKVVTPGLIAPMTGLGLVEVGAVARSRDAGEKKADITFQPSYAFNPASSLIAYTRKGGITSSLVAPSGGDDMFKGQVFLAELSGDNDSVIESSQAVLVELGSKSKGSRATNMQKLEEALKGAKEKLAKAKDKSDDDKKDKKDKKEPGAKEKLLASLVKGEKVLVAEADRATDILHLLDMKERYGLKLVIEGAGDAIKVKEQLAAQKVPVIISPLRNLPGSFDALHVAYDNAAELHQAGVDVVFTISDSHLAYQVRYAVGNAIAHGLDKTEAVAAMTSNVAEAFGLESGSIANGKPADLVLWSGDPFELSTKVDKLWIGGEEHTTESRHDKLRDRYTTDSNMPRAYTK